MNSYIDSIDSYSVYAVRFYSPSDTKTLRMRYVVIKSTKYALQSYIDNFAHELGVPNTNTPDRVSVFPAYLDRLNNSSFGDTYVLFDITKASLVFKDSVPCGYTSLKRGDIAYGVLMGFIDKQKEFTKNKTSIIKTEEGDVEWKWCPYCKHNALGNSCFMCKQNGYCNFEVSYH